MDELKNSSDPVPKKLSAANGTYYTGFDRDVIGWLITLAAQAEPLAKVSYINNEAEFRWDLLQDQMAFDKLHEGIKKFAEDGVTLKNLLKKKLSAWSGRLLVIDFRRCWYLHEWRGYVMLYCYVYALWLEQVLWSDVWEAVNRMFDYWNDS